MKLKKDGGFWLCFFLNMIFNFEWSIPGWILLALHFAVGISLWWSVAAFGIWIGFLLLTAAVIKWVSHCSNKPRKKAENKNPYSVKVRNPYEDKDISE